MVQALTLSLSDTEFKSSPKELVANINVIERMGGNVHDVIDIHVSKKGRRAKQGYWASDKWISTENNR